MKCTCQMVLILSLLRTNQLLSIAKDTTYRNKKSTVNPKLVLEIDRGIKTASDRQLLIFLKDEKQRPDLHMSEVSNESSMSSSIISSSSKEFNSGNLKSKQDDDSLRNKVLQALPPRMICIINGEIVPCNQDVAELLLDPANWDRIFLNNTVFQYTNSTKTPCPDRSQKRSWSWGDLFSDYQKRMHISTLLRRRGTKQANCGVINGVSIPCIEGEEVCIVNDKVVKCSDYKTYTGFNETINTKFNKNNKILKTSQDLEKAMKNRTFSTIDYMKNSTLSWVDMIRNLF